jgi:hypothetical protein
MAELRGDNMTEAEVDPNLKLIRHNSAGVNLPDDPSFPYKLVVNCSPPEFMIVTFVSLHGGSEEVVVRSKTKESLDRFIKVNNFKTHPRLRRLTITGPDGLVEEFKAS